jgi:hypothetical protein
MTGQDLQALIAERINGLQTARARQSAEFNAFIIRTDLRLERLANLQQQLATLSFADALTALEAAGITVKIGRD